MRTYGGEYKAGDRVSVRVYPLNNKETWLAGTVVEPSPMTKSDWRSVVPVKIDGRDHCWQAESTSTLRRLT